MPDTFLPAMYLPDGSDVKEFDEEPWEEVQRDPRGILFMFEPPKKGHKYILGCDSSVGITNWSRATRAPEDKKTDNGAIIVYDISGSSRPVWKEENGQRIPDIDPLTKRQRIQYLDVQVAEFAAPCDAVEIARIANVIGRIYCGDDEDQCELIWESYPGCGMLTTQELIRLGYGNLWRWEIIAGPAEETSALGWHSGFQSLQVLWQRARRHLMQENVVIRSKWLREEYANATPDAHGRAVAAGGGHDDRLMASNLALWAAHKWTYEIESERQTVSDAPIPTEYQNRAPVLGEDYTTWRDAKEAATDDWWS